MTTWNDYTHATEPPAEMCCGYRLTETKRKNEMVLFATCVGNTGKPGYVISR
jgi:hypothetical protein